MIMQKDIPQAYWHDYGGGGVPQAYSDSDDDDDALMFSRGSRGPSSVRPAAPSVVSGSSTAASAFAMARPVVATVADSFVTAVSSAVRTVRTVISGPAAPVEAFSEPVASGSGDVSDTGLAFSEPVEPGSVFSTRQVLDHLESEAVGGFNPATSESGFGEPDELPVYDDDDWHVYGQILTSVSNLLDNEDDHEMARPMIATHLMESVRVMGETTQHRVLDYLNTVGIDDLQRLNKVRDQDALSVLLIDATEAIEWSAQRQSENMHSIDEEDELTSDIADSASDSGGWTTTDEDEEEGGDLKYDATEAIEWSAERQSDPEIAALGTKEAIEKEAIAAMVTASIGRPGQQGFGGFVDHTHAVKKLTGALRGMSDRDKADVMEYLPKIHPSDLAALVDSPDSIQAPLIRAAQRRNAIRRGLR